MVKKTCQRSLYKTPYQGQNHHSWAVHSFAVEVIAVGTIAVSAGLAWTNPLSKNKSIIELVLRALCPSKRSTVWSVNDGLSENQPSKGIFSNNQLCQYFMERTGFLAHQRYRKAYNTFFFWFLMENSIVKIFGSVDVKITPDICS